MLSPLTITSLDQGKLYGSKPTIDEIQAGTAADFGLIRDEPDYSTVSDKHFSWRQWLRAWLPARARRLQPRY